MSSTGFGWGAPPLRYAPPAAAVPEDTASIKVQISPGEAPGFHDWFNKPLLSDITLLSADKQTFHCHKLLLSRWSAPLARMLTGDMLEGRAQSITLPNVKGAVLHCFLHFLYCCWCEVDVGELLPLLSLADQYDVPQLLKCCREAFLHHATNYKSCLVFYISARGDPVLLPWQQQARLQLLVVDTLAGLLRDRKVFNDLDAHTLLELLHPHGDQELDPAAPDGCQAGPSALGEQPPSSTGPTPTSCTAEPTVPPHPSGMAGSRLPGVDYGFSEAIGLSVGLVGALVRAQNITGHAAMVQANNNDNNNKGTKRRVSQTLLFEALARWLAVDVRRSRYEELLLECVDWAAMDVTEIHTVGQLQIASYFPHLAEHLEKRGLLPLQLRHRGADRDAEAFCPLPKVLSSAAGSRKLLNSSLG